MLDIVTVSLATRGLVIGRELNFRPIVVSTQDVAREAADRGEVEGYVSLADEQTRGRGRLGRSWVSPSGSGLHVSILLRPDASMLRGLPIMLPISVCHAIERVTGLVPAIKWPNDIVLNGRKLGGILIETTFVGDAVAYTVAGIGINVNLDASSVPEIRNIATSLSAECGKLVSREAVLIALLTDLDLLYRDLRAGAVPFEAWKARLVTLGQAVEARTGDRVEQGIAEDVREDGALVIRRADGSRVVVETGDVTLRG